MQLQLSPSKVLAALLYIFPAATTNMEATSSDVALCTSERPVTLPQIVGSRTSGPSTQSRHDHDFFVVEHVCCWSSASESLRPKYQDPQSLKR